MTNGSHGPEPRSSILLPSSPGNQTTLRRPVLLLLAPLLLGVAPSAQAADALASFRKWFGRYQAGRINLYQLVETGVSPVTVRDGGSGPDSSPARVRYFISEQVEEFERLLEGVVAVGGEAAARLLLEAATYACERDPIRERERCVQQQPWVVRRLALDALSRLEGDGVTEYLRRTALTDRSALKGPRRRAAAAEALGRIGDRESTAALSRLLQDEVRDVRLTVVRALGVLADPVVVAELVDLSRDSRDPLLRLEAILALDRLSEATGDEEIAAVRLAACRDALEDAAWPIRLVATGLLREHPDPSALPDLIRAIGKEAPGRPGSRRRVRSALRQTLAALTGEDFPSFRPDDWADWWEKNSDAFDLVEDRLEEIAPEQGARFFGIPVETDEVVFLLDVSGSMNQPVQGDPGGPSRLFTALRETRRCVEALEAGTRFNILLFNEDVVTFRESPVEKDAAVTAEVRQFLTGIEGAGGTDLIGALEHVLGLGGAGSGTGSQELDTLVLLTDGTPSRGTILIPEEILHQVTRSNRVQRVAIHTIDAGGREDPFLERLARDNFGSVQLLRR